MADIENENTVAAESTEQTEESFLLGQSGEEQKYSEPTAQDTVEEAESDENDNAESDSEEENTESYYSIEEIMNWNDEDGEIDIDKVPPQLLNLLTKLSTKKEDSSFEDQLKSVDDYEEEQIPGFTVNETLMINREAKRQAIAYLNQQGEKFDEYDDDHKEIVIQIKDNIASQLKKQKEEANKVRTLDNMLKSKYGSDYKRVDAEVSRYIDEEMSQAQLRKLNAAIRSGNKEIAMSLYDMAYKKLKGVTKEKTVKKRNLFPPHSISSGEPKRQQQKKEYTERDFLWEDTKWHSKM